MEGCGSVSAISRGATVAQPGRYAPGDVGIQHHEVDAYPFGGVAPGRPRLAPELLKKAGSGRARRPAARRPQPVAAASAHPHSGSLGTLGHHYRAELRTPRKPACGTGSGRGGGTGLRDESGTPAERCVRGGVYGLGVIQPLTGPPTWRHALAAFLTIFLISVCWYGLQPVPQGCVLLHGGGTSWKEAYRQALESGVCEEPARWRTWLE